MQPDPPKRKPLWRIIALWPRRSEGFRSRQSQLRKGGGLGDQDAKKALKRLECPCVIKHKRGNAVTKLYF